WAEHAVVVRQVAQVLLGQLPDLGQRRQAARHDPPAFDDRLEQSLGPAARSRLLLELDDVALETADPVDLLAARPGALLVSHLDLRAVGRVFGLVVDHLVDAAEGAAFDILLDRAGPDPETGADAEAVGRDVLLYRLGAA